MAARQNNRSSLTTILYRFCIEKGDCNTHSNTNPKACCNRWTDAARQNFLDGTKFVNLMPNDRTFLSKGTRIEKSTDRRIACRNNRTGFASCTCRRRRNSRCYSRRPAWRPGGAGQWEGGCIRLGSSDRLQRRPNLFQTLLRSAPASVLPTTGLLPSTAGLLAAAAILSASSSRCLRSPLGR